MSFLDFVGIFNYALNVNISGGRSLFILNQPTLGVGDATNLKVIYFNIKVFVKMIINNLHHE